MELTMSPRLKILLLVCMILFGWTFELVARDKTDVIILENGDTITGEIKILQRGILRVETDFIGTVNIEWPHVREVKSEYFFEVELSDGKRLFGSIQPAAEANQLEVTERNSSVQTQNISIVNITPIEGNFLDRINLDIELGASHFRANRTIQFTLGTAVQYRTEKYAFDVDYNTLFNQQKDTDATSRNELKTSFQRFLSGRWSVLGIGNFLQSEELKLKLRSLYGGGVMRDMIHTNSLILSVFGGAGINREEFTGEAVQTSAEGLTGFRL